jgi:hypothetical protein
MPVLTVVGLNIEAISFLVPLESVLPISVIAGEGCFCKGFPEAVHESLDRIRQRKLKQIDFFISHKPPDKYPTFPYKGIVSISTRPKYVIGRRYQAQIRNLTYPACQRVLRSPNPG